MPSIEAQIQELLEAGWTQKSWTVWKSPSGSLFRGPHGAWKALTATRNACECIDDDAWVCFRGQNIVGRNYCPCLCHVGGEEKPNAR